METKNLTAKMTSKQGAYSKKKKKMQMETRTGHGGEKMENTGNNGTEKKINNQNSMETP